MSKPPPGDDIFGDDRDKWITKARNAQYSLEAVRNSYVGNKRKILVDFAEILYDLGLNTKIESGAKVLDLFSGSAFVGYFFKSMGASVWSNELLVSSFLNALVLVENEEAFVSKESLESLLSPKESYADWINFPGAATKHIGTRFTENEARKLDAFAANLQMSGGLTIKQRIDWANHDDCSKIARLGDKLESRGLLDYTEDRVAYGVAISVMTVLHSVMDRCYVGGRLNSGQILASLEHRLEHQRNQGSEMSFENILPYKLSFNNGRRCIATNMDAIDLLRSHKPNVDIVYIDPPYGGGQSDYAEMYEFFEEYLGAIRKIEADRFIKNKSYSESFDELLSELPKNAVWIFSYNDDSWANVDEITAHIRSAGRQEIIVKEIDYRYKYRSKEKSSGTEYVIVVLP